jgi:hypothetical protein
MLHLKTIFVSETNNLFLFKSQIMQKSKILFIGIVILTLLFSACEKTPIIPNGEEVITTLRYSLSPSGGGTPVVLTFQDLDGDGGNSPIITGGTLEANQTYTGTLTLLNETVDPVDNISTEVEEEDADHQFFFESTVSGLSIQYTDMDDDGNPLGLSSTLTTTTAGSGTLKITLRHEPNKSATGVSTGDISNAGGETDIEVSFNITVQ